MLDFMTFPETFFQRPTGAGTTRPSAADFQTGSNVDSWGSTSVAAQQSFQVATGVMRCVCFFWFPWDFPVI